VRQQRCLTVEFSINTKDKITIKRNDYKISIETKKDLEMQLYALLHELGHFKIESKRIFPDVVEAKKFCQQYNLKPFRHTTETIADEICAWNQGELLFKSLNVNIPNNDKYQKFKFESLLTYF
jgi:Zn-dependent peptidase ImmA (M78 family)